MNELIVVRGGGDIATGTIHRLVKCGYKVIVTEVENPPFVRLFLMEKFLLTA